MLYIEMFFFPFFSGLVISCISLYPAFGSFSSAILC